MLLSVQAAVALIKILLSMPGKLIQILLSVQHPNPSPTPNPNLIILQFNTSYSTIVKYVHLTADYAMHAFVLQ